MHLLSDSRYALRTLRRSPGFAATLILIFGIGIGANTAMFSIVDGVLVRPLPFRDPAQLAAVEETVSRSGRAFERVPVNAMHVLNWRENWRSAEQVAMLSTFSMNLTSNGEPESVVMGRVSANLFSLLGVQPQLGRNFLESEDRVGADHVVILSDSLWQRRFYGDRNVLGSKILLDGEPFEVIGVLPPGVEIPKVSQLQSMAFGAQSPEVWKPFALRDGQRSLMGDFNYACIVRLKPRVTVSQAAEDLNGIQAAIGREVAEGAQLRAALTPLQEQITGRSRQGLLLLLLAVAAVLMIACVNIANLLLARSAGRSREFAVRAALGAGTLRLLFQMLTESLLVAMLGGALGVAIAAGALQLIVAKAPPDLPRLSNVHLDARALAVAFVLSLISAVVSGVVPAWRGSRVDPQDGLRAGGRSSTDSVRSGRLRSLLVSVEAGLCTVTIFAAGLLLSSFVKLLHVDKGFDSEHVITVDLTLPTTRYGDIARRSEFLRKALDSIGGLPGVTDASVSNLVPLTGEGSNNIINLDGDTTPVQQRPIADFRLVNEHFFRAMGIPLIAGRSIEASDRTHSVGVMSTSLAERLWSGQSPLGKKFHLGDPNGPAIEVIGVVGDVRGASLQKRPNPTVYVPYWQRDRQAMSLVVRTTMDPAGIASGVRASIHALDAELPVPQFRTLEEIVSASVAQRRFQLNLVALFAAIALGLASLGIYGVVSYSVAQRRAEMGLRMALGATASNLRSLVLRQGLAPVVVGLTAGLAGSIAVGHAMSSLLFGVGAGDPITLSIVTGLLLVVAAAACYLPARRATTSDPLEALRYE